MKVLKVLFKVLKVIFISILIVLLSLNIYIIVQSKLKPDEVPSIFKYKPFIVLSGSMEPDIKVGDLVIVKKTTIDELNDNDIIAFRDAEGSVTTHRIIKTIELDNKKCFKTKGDNNNTEDDTSVCENQIEGKYQSKISKIGKFIMFIQDPLGFTVIMLSVLIVCILVYFISVRGINKKVELSEEELKEFEEFKKRKLE